jgi:hypothetical protein
MTIKRRARGWECGMREKLGSKVALEPPNMESELDIVRPPMNQKFEMMLALTPRRGRGIGATAVLWSRRELQNRFVCLFRLFTAFYAFLWGRGIKRRKIYGSGRRAVSLHFALSRLVSLGGGGRREAKRRGGMPMRDCGQKGRSAAFRRLAPLGTAWHRLAPLGWARAMRRSREDEQDINSNVKSQISDLRSQTARAGIILL